jgi:hypothetical protein
MAPNPSKAADEKYPSDVMEGVEKANGRRTTSGCGQAFAEFEAVSTQSRTNPRPYQPKAVSTQGGLNSRLGPA